MSRVPGRALVLTAGRGTRLRPLSCLRAKAALPVAGQPLIRRVLSWLFAHDVHDVVLNLHHRPETITAVVGDGRDIGVRVRYSWEKQLLGSAGGPRRALPLLDAPRFFIINGDTLTDVDLAAVASTHDRAGAQVTMALVPNPKPDWYGGVVVEGGWVRRFTRAGSGEESFHFIGVQMAEADVFAGLRDDEPADSVNQLYRRLLAKESPTIAAFVSNAAFHDIGTPGDYLATSLLLAEREGTATWSAGARADATARVERSVLWEDVVVAAGAEIIECVLTDGIRIPPGTRLLRRVVVPRDACDEPLDRADVVDNMVVTPL